jgi:hypothetical protein
VNPPEEEAARIAKDRGISRQVTDVDPLGRQLRPARVVSEIAFTATDEIVDDADVKPALEKQVHQ